MEKIFCLFGIICISCLSYAQILPGGKQIALSHSDIAKSDDVFSIFSNPGGLARIKSIEVGAYYSPSPFGLDELQTSYVGCTVPTNFGVGGIGFMHYGYELYSINEVHAAFGRQYGSKLYYGLSLNYHHVSIENYGSASAILINAGFVSMLSEDISWGSAILNINQGRLGESNETLPSLYTTGFSWNPFNSCYLFLSLQKETGIQPSVNFGYSYSPIDNITLLSGYSTNPAVFSAGFSISYNFLEFDYAMTHHGELGYSHQISLIVILSGIIL